MRKRNPHLTTLLAWGVLSIACGESPMGPSDTKQPPAAPEVPKVGKPPAAASSAQVLYDARARTALPAGVEREPKLPPEREALVFSTLAPSYKTTRDQCAGASDLLFKVTASASGAFTAPAVTETAYVVASELCEPPGRGALEATHLIIVQGEKVVARASGKAMKSEGESPAFFGIEIRGVADVDQDGTQELLVTSSGVGQGVTEEIARLYTAKGGTIKLVKESSGVYVDGCSGGANGKVEAHVLRYTPAAKGTVPKIVSEEFEAACPQSGAPKPADFKPVAPPKPSPGPSASASSPTPAPSVEP